MHLPDGFPPYAIVDLHGRFLSQPCAHIISHWLNDFVAGIITPEFNLCCALAQLRGVIAGARRRIKLVALTSQVKYGAFGWPINLTALPIARHASADANHAAQQVRMRKGEAIV